MILNLSDVCVVTKREKSQLVLICSLYIEQSIVKLEEVYSYQGLYVRTNGS
jgi:recombinational DNA repair protein RecR